MRYELVACQFFHPHCHRHRYSPSSPLRSLTLRPSLLTSTFFPHLQNKQDLSLAVLLPPVDPTAPDILGHKLIVDSFNLITRLVNLQLTRQKCRHKKSLENICDQPERVNAEAIGRLAQLRSLLGELVHSVTALFAPKP